MRQDLLLKKRKKVLKHETYEFFTNCMLIFTQRKRKGAPSSKESVAVNINEEKMEEAASPEILRVTVTDAIIARFLISSYISHIQQT